MQQPHPEAVADRAPEGADGAVSVLERVLARGDDAAPAAAGSLREAIVSAWADAEGKLADGLTARIGASCLLRPAPSDRVLVWLGSDDQCWVLAVLHRPAANKPAVLTTSGPLAIEAPRIGISTQALHITSEDFLTCTRHRHAVEDTRTETSRVRVAQVGTDIRRTVTADDTVSGTFLQRAGTWISSTAREARLRARTFLFD